MNCSCFRTAIQEFTPHTLTKSAVTLDGNIEMISTDFWL